MNPNEHTPDLMEGFRNRVTYDFKGSGAAVEFARGLKDLRDEGDGPKFRVLQSVGRFPANEMDTISLTVEFEDITLPPWTVPEMVERHRAQQKTKKGKK